MGLKHCIRPPNCCGQRVAVNKWKKTMEIICLLTFMVLSDGFSSNKTSDKDRKSKVGSKVSKFSMCKCIFRWVHWFTSPQNVFTIDHPQVLLLMKQQQKLCLQWWAPKLHDPTQMFYIQAALQSSLLKRLEILIRLSWLSKGKWILTSHSRYWRYSYFCLLHKPCNTHSDPHLTF